MMNGPELMALVEAGEICENLNLSGKDYAEFDLGGGFFSRCDFSGSRLHGARLKEAVFIGCDLRSASFVDADCHHTAFHQCSLPDALFVGTNLVLTKFTEC